jgi:hypothetical protein
MMDDSEIEQQIATEESYRKEAEAAKQKAKAAAANPTATQSVSNAVGNAAGALGTGLWDIANPIHKNEEGNLDTGKTVVHSGLDALLGIATAATGAGIANRIYKMVAGVDPTIKAQNEISAQNIELNRQKLAFQQQQAAAKQAAVKPTIAPQAPVVDQQGLVAGLAPAPQQGVPPTQEQLIVERTAQMQNDLGKAVVPSTSPKVNAQEVNMLVQNEANKQATAQHQENEHSLDRYTRKMVVQAGMQDMNTKELSRLTGIDIRDQRDVQRAITKHNADRLASEGLKKSLEQEHGRKTLTEEQIKSRQALREMKAPGQPAGAVAPVNPQHGYQFKQGAVPPTFHLNPFNVFEGINKAKED